MKRLILLLSTIICTCQLLKAQSSGANKNLKLVWHDEFDYTGLPDKSKWAYEEGYNRDQEKEYYTRNRSKNASVDGNYLNITARKEKFNNPHFGLFGKDQSVMKYMQSKPED